MKEFQVIGKPVGRPRTNKIKVMITLDRELKKRFDDFLERNHLERSAYIENLLCLIEAIKSSNGLSALSRFLEFIFNPNLKKPRDR